MASAGKGRAQGRKQPTKAADAGRDEQQAARQSRKPSRTPRADSPNARPRAGASGARRRGDDIAHDNRPLMTVLVSGESGEQFDLLVDGRAYWGGDESPYRFEVRLEPGEHELRVRQRHALDRQPREFVPLIFAVLLGDGRRSEQGPYFAALDARVSVSADCRLTVKYALTGRVGRANGRAAFKCTPGKGMECQVLDTSMSSTPRLRRRWRFANAAALCAVTALALSVVGLGAYMCALPDGSVGGGALAMALGTLMAMGCALVAGEVRLARDGAYTPDIDPPPQPRPARKSKSPASTPAEDEPEGADADEPPAARKPRSKARKGRPRKVADADPYEGAYDDAGEMADFEEAGLSTADLTPEQLRQAKRSLLKKLGGDEDE